MKIKILKDTICSGDPVKSGAVVDVNEARAKNLIQMGKASAYVEPAKVEPAAPTPKPKAKAPKPKASKKESE